MQQLALQNHQVHETALMLNNSTDYVCLILQLGGVQHGLCHA